MAIYCAIWWILNYLQESTVIHARTQTNTPMRHKNSYYRLPIYKEHTNWNNIYLMRIRATALRASHHIFIILLRSNTVILIVINITFLFLRLCSSLSQCLCRSYGMNKYYFAGELCSFFISSSSSFLSIAQFCFNYFFFAFYSDYLRCAMDGIVPSYSYRL